MKNLYFDAAALTAEAHAAWRDLLELAGRSLNLVLAVHEGAWNDLDEQTAFVYLADSAALTRKLLLSQDRIYVRPRKAPARVDSFFIWAAQKEGGAHAWRSKGVRITLLSSIYRGDEFLDGFLENAAQLEGYAECEHFLLRAGSPGHEHARLLAHVDAQPAAVYVNLPQDPGLYEVWNLGLRLATGRYISNANIDDRRAADQLSHLANELDRQTEISLASGPLRVSRQRNLDWAASGDCEVWFANVGCSYHGVSGLLEKSGRVSRNLPHCMPLWRRSLHAWLGGFDERIYGPSADWALWLRAARRGCRFFFSGQTLGLYLHDEASYWRRNAQSQDFDRRILAEFGALTIGAPNVLPPGDLSEWSEIPLGLRLAKMIASGVRGLDCLGVMLEGSLEAVSAADSIQRLLARLAEDYWGCRDWPSLCATYRRQVLLRPSRALALRTAAIELIATFEVSLAAQGCRLNLELLCADIEETQTQGVGQMAFSLLARRCGEEPLVLRQRQAQCKDDPLAYWPALRAVDGFSRPLRYYCDEAAVFPLPVVSASKLPRRIVVYPDFTGNAYQSLLYAPLQQAGTELVFTSDEAELVNMAPMADAENILHVHWVTQLFAPWRDDKAGSATRAAAFLSGLAQQKARGFKLFWTIHNSVSHESIDPAAEIAFRQALYRLAHRVYIHHPLVADLLDWLPDREKLQICEHGHYDLVAPAAITKTMAREALGFAEDDLVLTHAGQVRDYKGLEEVLPTLFAQLQRLPRLKLVIAGSIRAPRIKQWLADHPHPRLIVQDVFLSEEALLLHMRAADMGLLAYRSILTSGSLFHWFSCARPVLAPALGTIPAYLVDGYNGLLYHDSESLQQGLAALQRLRREDLACLGEQALASVRTLSWTLAC